ncbi:MAG: NIL domain-containing protein [Eubacteriales bacterium]|nr:NIL domain-containing protein [Eubacteriales bacterium]
MKRKVKLIFPTDRTQKPVVARLSRDFNVDFSILNAQITNGMHGDMSLELIGNAGDIARSIEFLRDEGLHVSDISRHIVWDAQKCTACGCCTAVCSTGALSINENAELTFDSERCVVCEQCVGVCPLNTLSVNYEA